MPYIVTTNQTEECEGGTALFLKPVSRRAVATLDEAKEIVWAAMADVPRYALDMASRLSVTTHRLTEQGGSIGPLPDGTVIEVEVLAGTRLEREKIRLGLSPRATDEEFAAAYNAAQ